ncbi:hypothetical protein HTZ84_07820 [Haloterrigena sp. SYSU A558-1]|uniref:Uncharacterized protein n=1 Tax=Haloterrigena gelatinilytica TaxID=2741724 RepID=A0A8J8GP13_9EURY|nr:hypothetical protein [Haloterrigena gelatinilytica]NUB91957.1 hypothetical protein [Haloterrigena gelatinilytica]NUC72217.1 hypothetical protein [Haloterrigena gelatinilytica]
MPALQSVLTDWDVDRIYRAITAAAAVFLSLGVTDGAIAAVATTALLLAGFGVCWSVGTRIAARSRTVNS